MMLELSSDPRIVLVENYGERRLTLTHQCDRHEGHFHKQPHHMVVYRGGLEVTLCQQNIPRTPLGPPVTLRPGDAPFLVAADIWHTYKALEDDTQFGCRFQIRDKDGNPHTLEEIYPERVTIIDETWFY